MATRKRNEFLEPASEEDEDSEPGYDSEAAEETKGHSMKRRKMETSGGFLDNDDEEEDEGESDAEGSDYEDAKIAKSKGKTKKTKTKTTRDDDDELEGEDKDSDNDDGHYLDTTKQSSAKSGKDKPLKPLSTSKPPKKNKTGVIYFSTLPPYLRPFALKSMLETRGFAPITKIFLTPETRSPSAPRRRSNKRRTYTDGWVEFASKKTAKICAETLNATIVGGKKGGWYHDDVWNMKYLRGFKWGDLMEQVQRERGEREAKRRIEDARARKEDKVFVEGVEKGKVLDGMARKWEEKKKRAPEQGTDGDAEQKVNARRLFKQNEVKTSRDKIRQEDDRAALGENTKKVLSKIF